MSAEECLKKTYVKLYYIPPKQPARPVDCKQVKLTKNPEVRIFTGQISKLEGTGRGDLIGIDLHCAVPSTSGAGGVILLLQVSSYIEWEVEFTSTSVREEPLSCPAPWAPVDPVDVFRKPARPGTRELNYCPAPHLQVVRETHRVYVSLPVMYKISGPRIALMAITPWKLKLPVYAAQIWNAFKKLSELETVMAPILALKKGFCPEDIRAMEQKLKKLETEFNSLLQRASSGEGDIASRMRSGVDGTGRFAGSRVV